MASSESVVSLIDHAVLHPTQTAEDVRAACEMGIDLGVASICVKPSHLGLTAKLLENTPVVPSTVIGFPHGCTSTAAKVAETHAACQEGAREVDMVVNIGLALAEDWEPVGVDIAAVVEAAREHNVITKVIFETGLLEDPIKIKLCELSEKAGAAFVKTSTGFGFVKGPDGVLQGTGATEHDIQLMREHCGPEVQVKASGGIRSYADACKLVELGATRLGTSSTIAIAAGERGEDAVSSAGY